MIAFRRLWPLVLGLTLAACGDDSTGPSVEELAARFDALASDRADAGDPNGAAAARGAALALRLGVEPARVSIAVDGVTEEYLAFETEYAYGDEAGAGPLPPLPILVRTMIAWRGAEPDRFLAIAAAGDTGTFFPPCAECLSGANLVYWLFASGMMVERGGPSFLAVAGGARMTRQSLGSECEPPQAPAFIPALEPVACHRAVFFTRFTMTATEMGNGARSRVVQMGGHDVPGVRLLYPPLPTM